MRVEGTDILLKIMLDSYKKEGKVEGLMREAGDTMELESEPKERIVRDMRIVSAENEKEEVQFTRGKGESPEKYLQRVSSEIVRERELKSRDNIGIDKERATRGDIMGMSALYNGLWFRQKGRGEESLQGVGSRFWKVIIVMGVIMGVIMGLMVLV